MIIICFSAIVLIGCGSSKAEPTIVNKINSYRTKGVTCANNEYTPTHKLTMVDEYEEGRYDYDALYAIGPDEPLESLFDDEVKCGYLFGEFTQFVGYDGEVLFLGGRVSVEQ